MTSIKEAQKKTILRMLRFNEAPDEGDGAVGGWSEQWKVLVFDPFCRDIISPLLNVSDLRKQGVTLHLLLGADRDPITDVPAVYFVMPTEENVARIASDCGSRLYRAIHLNFAAPIPRPLLESFARSSIEADGVTTLSKIFDQYCAFVALEHNLFSLNMQGSFAAYNSPSVTDEQVEAYLESVAQGVLGALATLGVVPVIRAPVDGPAEIVARRLCDMLRDHVAGRSQLFPTGVSAASAGSFQRPVLVLLDRTADMCSAVQHSVSYQALVDDLLPLRLNRVSVRVGGEDKPRDVHLEADADAFWREHAGAAFPEAIQAHSAQLERITREEAALRSQLSSHDAEDSHVVSATATLADAADRLPELMAQKKLLETHAHLLSATMDAIGARHVPTFFEMEETMLVAQHVEKVELLQLLRDPERGTVADKLRLLLVYMLGTRADAAEVDEVVAVFETAANEATLSGQYAGPNPAPVVSFAKRHRSLMRISGGARATDAAESGSWLGVADRVTGNAASSLFKRAKATVNTLLPRSKSLLATRAAEAACEYKSAKEFESMLYLDPKLASSAGEMPPLAQRVPFRHAIVFVIGGGHYTEYHNLQEAARRAGRQVTYGCTELLNADGFIAQLAQVGAPRG